jgi:hypothetical protein
MEKIALAWKPSDLSIADACHPAMVFIFPTKDPLFASVKWR